MENQTASIKANKSNSPYSFRNRISGGPAAADMTRIPIETETIRLAQLLKLANVVQDGAEAKFRIVNGEITVNGAVETRRGRKLRHGDRVEFAGETYEVVSPDPSSLSEHS